MNSQHLRFSILICAISLNGSHVWGQTVLRDFVPPDFQVGGVMGGYDTNLQNTPVLDLAASEFSAVTTKAFMPFGPWTNGQLPIDTEPHTRNVTWARANRLLVHAHVLVYPTENLRLPWFQELDDQQVPEVLEQYVTTMAESTAGSVWVWDVVNEVIGDNGDVMDANGIRIGLGTGPDFRPYKEYSAMGEDYIAESFRWARAADPNAILILNEYAAEELNDKSDRLFALCTRLKEQGVPIDGVGFQNHWLDLRYEPYYDGIRANFQRFAEAGFKIFITECDVAAVHALDPIVGSPSASDLQRQARVFGGLMRIALEQPACKSFLMWDFTDETSWLQNTDFTLTLADRRPGQQDTVIPPGVSMFATPFSGGDGDIPVDRKPAYAELVNALGDSPDHTYRVTSGWEPETSMLARFGVPVEPEGYEPASGVYLERLDNTTEPWQSLKWQVERVEPGVFRIRNWWSDDRDYLTRQLETDSAFQPGTNVALQASNLDWFSQRWLFLGTGDGGYRVANSWSPLDGFLTREAAGQDVDGQYVPGVEIRLYPIEDWSSQVWYFDRVSP